MADTTSTPATQAEPITVPRAVERVIDDRRDRLHQIRSLFAGAYAMAEAANDSSEVRWAMEAALELFQKEIDDLDPVCIRRDAQEVAHG